MINIFNINLWNKSTAKNNTQFIIFIDPRVSLNLTCFFKQEDPEVALLSPFDQVTQPSITILARLEKVQPRIIPVQF